MRVIAMCMQFHDYCVSITSISSVLSLQVKRCWYFSQVVCLSCCSTRAWRIKLDFFPSHSPSPVIKCSTTPVQSHCLQIKPSVIHVQLHWFQILPSSDILCFTHYLFRNAGIAILNQTCGPCWPLFCLQLLPAMIAAEEEILLKMDRTVGQRNSKCQDQMQETASTDCNLVNNSVDKDGIESSSHLLSCIDTTRLIGVNSSKHLF